MKIATGGTGQGKQSEAPQEAPDQQEPDQTARTKREKLRAHNRA
jgi:hypothetical protein